MLKQHQRIEVRLIIILVILNKQRDKNSTDRLIKLIFNKRSQIKSNLMDLKSKPKSIENSINYGKIMENIIERPHKKHLNSKNLELLHMKSLCMFHARNFENFTQKYMNSNKLKFT